MRTALKTILLILILAMTGIINGCQQQGKPDTGKDKETKAAADLDRSVGWIHDRCLAIKNTTLADGQKFQMISLGTPQQLHDAKIVRETTSANNCAALQEGRREINMAQGYKFYEISSIHKNPVDLALGLVGLPLGLNKSGEIINGDINGDGKLDYFTQCTTSEGVRFNVWSEKTYHQDPIWSGYYYLDYDAEPNCP